MIRDGVLVKKGKARAAGHLDVNFASQIYERIREHPQFAWLPK